MIRHLALAVLLAPLSRVALGCTLIVSPEYRISDQTSIVEPVDASVVAVSFEPWIRGCDAGLIVVTLRGSPASELKQQGYFVRPVSGVHPAGSFPVSPLAPDSSTGDTVSISWSWDALVRDSDGHVRWRFEIVPVSPSGVLGSPVSACASTDDSCP